MRTLAQIELVVLTRLNNLRCIQRLIASSDFRIAFEALEPEKKEVVLTAIETGDKDEIIKLVQNNIEDKSVRELRTLARELGIGNPNNLTKPSLLAQIKAARSKNVTV
jgi:uncharacterized protein (DUF2344 family)